MNKFRSVLLGLFLVGIFIFLSACGTEDKERKEVKVESEETEKVSFPDLELEESRTIIDKLTEDLTNILISAGEKHNLTDKPLTDEVYHSMTEEFKAYATEQMIEKQLYDIAKEFCYAGCDAYYLPKSTNLGIRYKIINYQNGTYTMEYVTPENELTGSTIESVTLSYENGDWKMDSFQRKVSEDINVTKEEAVLILQKSGFDNVEYVEEKKINDRNVYVYKVIDENTYIGIVDNTGYVMDNLNDLYNETSKEISTNKPENTSKDKSYFYQKMSTLEQELAWIDDQYDIVSVAEMYNLEEQRYKEWDKILNEIYGVIQEVLPATEMEELRKVQREWIVYRDTKAEKGTDQLGGGWSGLQRMINLVDLTKKRCYELVDGYL